MHQGVVFQPNIDGYLSRTLQIVIVIEEPSFQGTVDKDIGLIRHQISNLLPAIGELIRFAYPAFTGKIVDKRTLRNGMF
jgi:hypothetical protein